MACIKGDDIKRCQKKSDSSHCTMGQKRGKDVQPLVTRKRQRKLKKKRFEAADSMSEGNYDVLNVEEDEPNKNDDIILVDSDEDKGLASDVIVVSEDEGDEKVEEVSDPSSKTLEKKPASKKPQDNGKPENDIVKGSDFIEFGFSSSESEHEEEGQYSDDGILSDDDSGSHHVSQQSKLAFPWVKGHDHSKQKEIADWLTLEIKDFVNYISPSSQEIVNRNTLVNNLKKKITEFWPKTQAHVFGSCATDLYLPGSDIDMVIISTTGDYEQRQKLYSLASYLRKNQLAKNIEVIASAKVPIIKFVDPTFNIHVDISFERSNGLDAARRIRRWLDLTPGLRELVLIIKQFLRSRKLNNVHVGGLGGYATIIMVYHFLKLHPRVSTGNVSVMDNLGTLLIEFFELYGRNFSYDDLIIAINREDDSPMYLLKSKHHALTTGRGVFSIIIQDPSDPLNNITRSSYNLRDIKKAFGGAYQLLVDKCYELNGASYRNRINQLILGDIIKYRGKDRDFNDDRHKVANHALIEHEEDEEDEESDGADGNDKYYLSDMTLESDEEPPRKRAKEQPSKKQPEPKQPKQQQPEQSNTPFVLSLADEKLEPKPVSPRKTLVADYMSVNDGDEDKSEAGGEADEAKEYNKYVKREYWKLKGLETSI